MHFMAPTDTSTPGTPPPPPPTINLTISANVDSLYVIKDYADAAYGSSIPAFSTINVTIANGVRVRSMSMGALVGCNVYLDTQQGVIYGVGGNAGAAQIQAGSAGGDALTLTGGNTIIITNANGYILGGGGGGGSGAALTGDVGHTAQAGGGGGGAGGGVGGAGGGAPTNSSGGTSATDGTVGALPAWGGAAWTNVTGNGAGQGPHGEGGTAYPTIGPSSGPVNGGDGGDGGGWGEAGEAGHNGTVLAFGGQGGYLAGAAGGTAGRAIRTNTATVIWISGNDATHVRGTVA